MLPFSRGLLIVLAFVGAASARDPVPGNGACDWGLAKLPDFKPSCSECAGYVDGRAAWKRDPCVYVPTRSECAPKTFARNQKYTFEETCAGSPIPANPTGPRGVKVSSALLTCNAYCASKGKTCGGAWEDNDLNDCVNFKSEETCTTNFKTAHSGTSDMCCLCGAALPPTPLRTRAPTPPTPPPTEPVGGTFAKPSGSKLRVASYNCFRTSIVPTPSGVSQPEKRFNEFKAVALAVKADIWAFQEFFYGAGPLARSYKDHVASEMKSITGDTWYASGDYNTDNAGEFLVSKYPIKWEKQIGRRTYATLVDLSRIGEKNLLILNVHFMKQGHGDETGNWLKSLDQGKIDGMSKDVTIMVCGDFNAGLDSSRYNAVAKSISGLNNLRPLHLNSNLVSTIGGATRTSTGDPETATWTHKGGRIDFLLVKENGMRVSNTFIMNTFVMRASTLAQNNLKRVYNALAPQKCVSSAKGCRTDHLPMIADFGGQGSFNSAPRAAAYSTVTEATDEQIAAYQAADVLENEVDGDGVVDGVDGVNAAAGRTIEVVGLLLVAQLCLALWR